MALPGTAASTYVADGLEHCESGKPSTAAHDHEQQLAKRARKLQDFDYGDHWADIRGAGDIAFVTWGSSTAAVREAAERLRDAGRSVKVIALRLLLPARPALLAEALAGVERVIVVEQSHGSQFYRYLRAYYDIAADCSVLARSGPLPLTPGEIVSHFENWS
jgi:2-oxoglutarate ferredoxin oxidoreductase subunit alpha